MKLSFHVNFDGRCAEAFQFYQQHLNGVISSVLSYKDSPMASEVPSEWQDKILHGNIEINNFELAGTDTLPEQYEKPSGFCLLLRLDSEQEVHRLFEALAIDGNVVLSPQQTFWSPCYAIVTDQFGVPWKLNCVA